MTQTRIDVETMQQRIANGMSNLNEGERFVISHLFGIGVSPCNDRALAHLLETQVNTIAQLRDRGLRALRTRRDYSMEMAQN